jgi:hypothetical protein
MLTMITRKCTCHKRTKASRGLLWHLSLNQDTLSVKGVSNGLHAAYGSQVGPRESGGNGASSSVLGFSETFTKPPAWKVLAKSINLTR